MVHYLYVVGLVAALAGLAAAAVDPAEEAKAKAFLDYYNQQASEKDFVAVTASWGYATNLTTVNLAKRTQAHLVFSNFMKIARQNASKFDLTKLSNDTKRQINFLTATASSKDTNTQKRLNDVEGEMDQIYGSGKVKDKDGSMLSLDPELSKILSSSRDYDRLTFAWKGWRDATGPKLRPLYKEFVELSNKGAKENGWADTGAWWRSWYEEENLETIVENLYKDLKPLYQELHAYVRYKLSKKYSKVSADGPIPAHLFGNMWAQSWVNIYDLVEPYANQSSLDVTKNMVKNNYTALKMVKLAESFFTSIGLKALPPSFYQKSMITKPKGREVQCHASAWDFKINKDVRIKQCTGVTHNYLVTTHHELGHIQYYLQYWDQAFEYRSGANPGFHEAVGDTLSLSVDTPTHLKLIGLLDSVSKDNESDINALMKMALRKVAFLPFGFMIDQWRWKVFRGEITPENYNKEWWKLRTNYQGIKPPVCRTENDFDPGAKYHIPGNTPYIRYFVSFVLQFQFHKAACALAGHQGPIHKCSIYNSTAAGNKLGDMLALGKSQPWPNALEQMTGTRTMDVGALKEYFKPLSDWLKEQRSTYKYPIGWSNDGAYEECKTKPPNVGTNMVVSNIIIGTILAVLLCILY